MSQRFAFGRPARGGPLGLERYLSYAAIGTSIAFRDADDAETALAQISQDAPLWSKQVRARSGTVDVIIVVRAGNDCTGIFAQGVILHGNPSLE